MITDPQYTAWLSDDDTDPVVLIEAAYDGATAGTEYVANAIYPGPGEVSVTRIYDEIVLGNISIDSRLDRLTIGQVTLIDDGDITAWLDRVWRGHPIKFYLGDRSWDRTDFRLQIEAINGGIKSIKSDRLAWTIYDLSDTLRVEIGSETLPICLGKTFNVKPVLIDAATDKFKVHDGAVTSIAVRDNGVSVTPTFDLPNGEFTLAVAPAGQITCDVVQADQSAADMIDKLCADNSISVNSTNLTAFSNTDPLGMYIDKPTSMESVVREIMASVGGSYRFNLSGELEIWRLEAPGTGTTTLIADDIEEDGLKQASTEYPITQLTLGYKKNWAVQSADSLAGSLTTQQRDDYSTEYQLVSKSNTLTDYPLSKDERKNSLFYVQADAQSECDRRAALRNTKRSVSRAKCYLSAAEVTEGEDVNITYPGVGFESGQDAVIIGIRQNLGKRRIELSLWS